jgi:hypothetical protein
VAARENMGPLATWLPSTTLAGLRNSLAVNGFSG